MGVVKRSKGKRKEILNADETPCFLVVVYVPKYIFLAYPSHVETHTVTKVVVGSRRIGKTGSPFGVELLLPGIRSRQAAGCREARPAVWEGRSAGWGIGWLSSKRWGILSRTSTICCISHALYANFETTS
jgi:hypothetical protein